MSDFRPDTLILHDYAGTPKNQDGVFNPYHALVFPDGSIRYRYPNDPYGQPAPHAYRANPSSLGLSYAGPYGGTPTEAGMARLRQEYDAIRQRYPDLKVLSHGEAYSQTRGTDRQASRAGRDMREASWRDVLRGNATPAQQVAATPPDQFANPTFNTAGLVTTGSQPVPAGAAGEPDLASRSLVAAAGLTEPRPRPPGMMSLGANEMPPPQYRTLNPGVADNPEPAAAYSAPVQARPTMPTVRPQPGQQPAFSAPTFLNQPAPGSWRSGDLPALPSFRSAQDMAPQMPALPSFRSAQQTPTIPEPRLAARPTQVAPGVPDGPPSVPTWPAGVPYADRMPQAQPPAAVGGAAAPQPAAAPMPAPEPVRAAPSPVSPEAPPAGAAGGAAAGAGGAGAGYRMQKEPLGPPNVADGGMWFRPGSWDSENKVFFDPKTQLQKMNFQLPSFKGLFG